MFRNWYSNEMAILAVNYLMIYSIVLYLDSTENFQEIQLQLYSEFH